VRELQPFSIVAAGDVSFRGYHEDNPRADILYSVSQTFKDADLSIANLESALTDNGIAVPNKCTLRGSTGWAKILRQAGIQAVTLANNHLMDYSDVGLRSTIKACDEAGIYHAGAGQDIEEAAKPVFVNAGGNTIALLSRTSVFVGSPSYASERTPGVCFLDEAKTIEAISACKKMADFVILSVHWGVESYNYPSQEQRELAKRFTQAGADLIIGHHPHVLQGIEQFDKSTVIYSLGNFVFNEFDWSFRDANGSTQTRHITLAEENRIAGMVRIRIDADGIQNYTFHPTIIDNDGIVLPDQRDHRQKDFARLCARLKNPFYGVFWQIYSTRMEWKLRIRPLVSGKFTLRKLRRFRFSHIRNLIVTIIKSIRISLGKSSSPYE
jgi:poly-gamma-glutamate capsule biosynthesis protein CapA/YwtB (metallophosphatase superfamily)